THDSRRGVGKRPTGWDTDRTVTARANGRSSARYAPCPMIYRLSSPLGVLRARGGRWRAMLLSAEVRWFWEGRIPELTRWFGSGPFAPGGGEVRVDTYVGDPAQLELGVKSRGNKPGL